MNKEGWLKVGVVGVPICAYIMLVHLPTTSPYGYSSFPKEEIEIPPTCKLLLNLKKNLLILLFLLV